MRTRYTNSASPARIWMIVWRLSRCSQPPRRLPRPRHGRNRRAGRSTGATRPQIDPANFVATIDNRYFPLEPGTGFHYRGVADRTPQTDDMVVTHQTKQILGVTCTVVRDTVSEHGQPIERTFDWYAQDKQGNVWYMGEDTRELQHGHFVKAERLVGGRRRRRQARDHHARRPAAGRRVPAGVLPAR